ncbi:peptide-methionine (S)-S-oxide reductase [Tenacibaculum sp. MAR_2009_124]|uniref:peptide methionine sulfoxide reductase n=1 Tax=Tenacibaculum sp. MAR_2009_124 TaxID=1250059 RepID=UPI000898ECD9|nr:peptide methionine sulfoxide reductase [Tenacibaculum sp. MAR_2009_124]SED16031.1 peptide-methionine (S)-S-oxide reductase [Tenacibaculum sp. MAR_2009_124]
MNSIVLKTIKDLPEGYSEGIYMKKKYGISKASFNKGKSFKIYAKELGGTDVISLNYYITSTAEKLKPCEMPEQKVLHFLHNVEPISQKNT